MSGTAADGEGFRHRLTRFFYRRYRAARTFFGARRPDVFTRAFFAFRARFQNRASARTLTELDRVERRLWKASYFHRFGAEPLFRLVTARTVAADSPDHKWPKGTAFDNSSNRNFNLKLYALLGFRNDLRALDLGCSGGGLVKSFIEDGFTGVGIEGSDWSRKLRSGEWDTIPHHLFTADITSRFELRTRDDMPVRFHCITAWEVLEHIPADRLPGLIDNIARHLAEDGVFVASVDTAPDNDPVTGAVYHVTLQQKPWWLEQFARHGLVEAVRHNFTTRDYVRGHGMGLADWDPADGEGFHLVLQKRELPGRA